MKKYNYDMNAPIPLKPINLFNQLQQVANSNQANGTFHQTNKKDLGCLKFIENLDILLAQEQKNEQELASGNSQHGLNLSNSNNTFGITSLTNTPSKYLITEVSNNTEKIFRHIETLNRYTQIISKTTCL